MNRCGCGPCVPLMTDDGRQNVRAATTTVRVTTPLRVSAATTALARTARDAGFGHDGGHGTFARLVLAAHVRRSRIERHCCCRSDSRGFSARRARPGKTTTFCARPSPYFRSRPPTPPPRAAARSDAIIPYRRRAYPPRGPRKSLTKSSPQYYRRPLYITYTVHSAEEIRTTKERNTPFDCVRIT